MATPNQKPAVNASRSRTGRVKRRMTIASLGVLLAAFGAVAATGVPAPAPDPLRDVFAGPAAVTSAETAATLPNAPVIDTATGRLVPRAQPVPQAPRPVRRPRTRMS